MSNAIAKKEGNEALRISRRTFVGWLGAAAITSLTRNAFAIDSALADRISAFHDNDFNKLRDYANGFMVIKAQVKLFKAQDGAWKVLITFAEAKEGDKRYTFPFKYDIRNLDKETSDYLESSLVPKGITGVEFDKEYRNKKTGNAINPTYYPIVYFLEGPNHAAEIYLRSMTVPIKPADSGFLLVVSPDPISIMVNTVGSKVANIIIDILGQMPSTTRVPQ